MISSRSTTPLPCPHSPSSPLLLPPKGKGYRRVVDGGRALGRPYAAVAGVGDGQREAVLRGREAQGRVDEGEAGGAGAVRGVEGRQTGGSHLPVNLQEGGKGRSWGVGSPGARGEERA